MVDKVDTLKYFLTMTSKCRNNAYFKLTFDPRNVFSVILGKFYNYLIHYS